MCLGPQVVPPTQNGRKYRNGIRVLIIFQGVIVILNLIAANQFLQQAVFGLFFIFILYMIQHRCSYQGLMIFVFISLFFAVSFMIYFLTPIQNGKNPSQLSSLDKFIYADSIVSFCYYVTAMIYSFYPYRQNKAIAFNQNPTLRRFFQDADQQQPNNQNRPEPNSHQVDFQPVYGNIEYNQGRRNNDNGMFQVFKGQGLRVG